VVPVNNRLVRSAVLAPAAARGRRLRGPTGWPGFHRRYRQRQPRRHRQTMTRNCLRSYAIADGRPFHVKAGLSAALMNLR
jgi:hypothetical protein